MIKYIRNVTLLVTLFLTSYSALAWDGIVTGKVGAIDTVAAGGSAPGNQDLRVYLTSGVTMCGTTANWAYVNVTDANYKGMLAATLTAKAMNLNVTLYTTRVGGYCQLGYMQMN